jgi:hypothetical protein
MTNTDVSKGLSTRTTNTRRAIFFRFWSEGGRGQRAAHRERCHV